MDSDLKMQVHTCTVTRCSPEERKRQFIDVQENSSPKPLPEVKASHEREAPRNENKDSECSSADSRAGDLLSSGTDDVQDV